MLKFAFSLLAAALLAGPVLAAEPAPQQPAAASHAPARPAPAWWSALPDPVLAALIERGLAGNLALAQADARIRRSQALLAGARASLGPSGSAGLQGRFAQAAETEAPGLTRAQRRGDSIVAGLDFSWELDLFGRLRAQAGAATQRLAATEAETEGVRLAVSTEIAHAYFALVGARELLQLSRGVVANRQRTLQVVEARVGGGLSAPLDDARARTELETALADIPVHEAAEKVSLRRLAVLTGASPAGFELPTAGTVAPASVAIGLPEAAQWLAQRPDLRAHEAELRARALDVAAVRAEFFPRFTITGVLGFVAGSVSGLGAAGSISWLGSPALLAPLFDRPRIQARLDQVRADQQQALAAYRQRVLLATEEVENALALYASGQQQFHALQRRARHAGEAERLARVRYEAGAADLLELLDAQRTAQQADAALAQVLMQQRQNLVAVFKGIGGGTS